MTLTPLESSGNGRALVATNALTKRFYDYYGLSSRNGLFRNYIFLSSLISSTAWQWRIHHSILQFHIVVCRLLSRSDNRFDYPQSFFRSLARLLIVSDAVSDSSSRSRLHCFIDEDAAMDVMSVIYQEFSRISLESLFSSFFFFLLKNL